MSSFSDAKRNLRKRSEEHLRRAVLSELGRDEPSTVAPHTPKGGRMWGSLFVPLYRKVPWSAKERAMGALGMTARGWKAPERKPGEPWRPPADMADRVAAAQSAAAAPSGAEPVHAEHDS
jgi:hypothetical protein